MSYIEYRMWEEFRKTHPFNTQELQLAAIAHISYTKGGGEATLEDFLPSVVLSKDRETEDIETSPLDLDLALRGMFK